MRKTMDMADPTTKGQQLLQHQLRHSAMSQQALADLLGIKQSSVSLWVSGRSRPEAHLRLALEGLWEIPAESWLTLEEAEVVARATDAAPPSARVAAKRAPKKPPRPAARATKRTAQRRPIRPAKAA